MKVIVPDGITENLAEETGWHIGDGSMNYYNNKGRQVGIYQLRGHREDDKDHYIQRIKPIFDALYKTNISLREMPSNSVYGFQAWSSDLIKFKQKLGLPIGKKFNIVIPDAFLNDDSFIKAVIRGIFDTDGSIYLERKNKKIYPRVYITTISEGLANQLLSLLKSLGLNATKYSQLSNKEFNRQRAFIITLRGEEMLNRFIKEISPKNPKHLEKYKRFLDSKTL